jgi:hypothetical protein
VLRLRPDDATATRVLEEIAARRRPR